ncbi:MAG: YbhB/YbcL family Raf kinase inhibitor-like protein [Elusimicrobia bacterium]|nr:YbhB/YbcL family Raf kinase inhibitor-like protein [Elusimicrobiota bacterium]
MKIECGDFHADGEIPVKFTCQGEDVSPALSWNGVPREAASLALLCEDPDAPGGLWVHWVAYDLPASLLGLPEGVPRRPEVPGGGLQGVNDFGRAGYGGPCPPHGPHHRYYFRLYALDRKLGLPPKASRRDLLAAMEGRVVGQAELMGRYKRQPGG